MLLRRCLLIGMCFLLLGSIAFADDPPYGNVKLLDGYKYKRSHTTDTINGAIFKEGGLWIEFESGMNEGYAVDPKDRKNYLWFREQEIDGHRIFLALTKPNVGTRWKASQPRGSKRILIVTFPGKLGPMQAANFYAEVMDDREVADMLLMVLTFDSSQ